jgi:hypothetical protein
MKKISFASLLFACFVLLAATSARAQITNGSFESDYTGWTLVETPLAPCTGTWGIATNGFTLNPLGSVFDFTDNLNCVQFSPGLPITFAATDGNKLAFQLQNGPQFHRMFQEVAIGPPATLHWDMQYRNHFLGEKFRLQEETRRPFPAAAAGG